MTSFRPLFFVLFSASSIAACTDGGGVLTDRDGGTDAPVPDAGHDAPPGDAGPPPIDAGPGCASRDPIVPTDPRAGAWEDRFANPGVGGDLPNVGAFAFGNDGTVYVGGDFTTAGYAPASNVASWTSALGWRALGAGLSGRVRSLLVDGTNRLWAAYAPDDGWDPTRIARWDGTTWTTIADTEGAIDSLELLGTTLYVSGNFTRIGGVDLAGLARFDGTTWSGWPGLAPDASIRAVSVVSADDVCVGGDFATLGVLNARQAACWNGTTWLDRSLPLEHYRGVLALERDPADGALVAAGDFMLDDLGTNGGSIARWETDHWALVGGGVMSELGAGSTKEIRGMAFTSTGLFVGGAFELVDAEDPRPASGVARWDGTEWDDLGGVFSEVGFGIGTSNVLAVGSSPDGSVFLGGLFTRAGALRVAHVVRWDGTYWSALRTPGERYEGVGGSVVALARHQACAIYLGGTFQYAGGVRANAIARYTREGGYEALGSGFVGSVTDIAVTTDELVYAAGEMVDAESGTVVRNIGLWDGARWRGLGAGLDGTVWGVAVDESEAPDTTRVYAAGTMTTSGDTPVTRLGLWDGAAWTDLGVGFSGHPYEFDPTTESDPYLYEVIVDPDNGDVIVGGSFDAVGVGDAAVSTSNVARFDGERWHAYGDGLGDLFGSVLALAWWEGRLVAAGSFTTSGTADVSHVAVWNGTAWEAVGTDGPDGFTVAALEAVGPALYAGGTFMLGGGTGAHVAVYSGDAWHDLEAGVSDVVEALVTMDEGVYIGGTFDRAGASPSVGLALWRFEE